MHWRVPSSMARVQNTHPVQLLSMANSHHTKIYENICEMKIRPQNSVICVKQLHFWKVKTCFLFDIQYTYCTCNFLLPIPGCWLLFVVVQVRLRELSAVEDDQPRATWLLHAGPTLRPTASPGTLHAAVYSGVQPTAGGGGAPPPALAALQ